MIRSVHHGSNAETVRSAARDTQVRLEPGHPRRPATSNREAPRLGPLSGFLGVALILAAPALCLAAALAGDALIVPVVEEVALLVELGDGVRVIGVDLLVDAELRPAPEEGDRIVDALTAPSGTPCGAGGTSAACCSGCAVSAG